MEADPHLLPHDLRNVPGDTSLSPEAPFRRAQGEGPSGPPPGPFWLSLPRNGIPTSHIDVGRRSLSGFPVVSFPFVPFMPSTPDSLVNGTYTLGDSRRGTTRPTPRPLPSAATDGFLGICPNTYPCQPTPGPSPFWGILGDGSLRCKT